ncbi:MAG: hypothetical protein ACK2UK_00010 [Candidatus Promineifilaceae bacterium]|jgi:hypothetical protein
MKKSSAEDLSQNGRRAASEYAVQRVGENAFEIWHENRLLATLSKEEAWPVMIGQVHPESVINEEGGDPGSDQREGRA